MKILHVGDIVGAPGRLAFSRIAGRMKREGEVDFIVANAENTAAGRGITPGLAEEVLNAGADVITLGDHTWDQKELAPWIDREPRVIRPANFAPGCPGKGWYSVDTPKGRITILQVIGRVFMPPAECPFRAADEILKRGDCGKIVIAEMHCEATSEKIAFGRYLEGRATHVGGTHTHVQTSDDVVLPKGTSYITDLGMTGPKDSVLGREVEPIIKKFLTGMPHKMDVATGDVCLEGVIITLDPATGRASKIKRIREAV
jgi:metallophosphoesterase (TIGR00282 family)